MRKALQIVGVDDPGDTGDGAGTGGTGDNDNPPTNNAATVPDTFDQYDPATQNEASSFYEANVAATVNDLFEAQRADLEAQLNDLVQQGLNNAEAAGAAAANNAAANLGTAVGVAVGAAIGGPIGAALGALVGGAIYAYVREAIPRMLTAFQDAWDAIFG